MCTAIWPWRSICWAKSIVVFEVYPSKICSALGGGGDFLLISKAVGLGVFALRAWVGMFRPWSQDSQWRGSDTPIYKPPISTPQRPCQVGACQLSSPSLLPLGPKVKFSFCSLVWFLVVPPDSSAPEPLASGFFRNFKVEISKLGLYFSWQVCNRWEISHWRLSYPESC